MMQSFKNTKPNMTKQTNKVAIITGATTGIGKATKELLRSNGCIVYNLDVAGDKDDGTGYYINCDVRKREEIKSAVEKIFNKERKID
jgi:NADP-dependent 3-hydroxy acid dehydrogenase YdfG